MAASVHVYGNLAEVWYDNGDIEQDVPVCDHSERDSDQHTIVDREQSERESRPKFGAKAEGRTMQNDKYVVFKAKDVQWPEDDSLNPGMYPALAQVMSEDVVGDAVVIRLQDVFAGPGLYAYANAIQTGIDLLEIQELTVGGTLEEPLIHRLQDLRDFFADMAQKAVDHSGKKIPD